MFIAKRNVRYVRSRYYSAQSEQGCVCVTEGPGVVALTLGTFFLVEMMTSVRFICPRVQPVLGDTETFGFVTFIELCSSTVEEMDVMLGWLPYTRTMQ